MLEVVWQMSWLGMLSCSLSLALQLQMSSRQSEKGHSCWLAWGQVEEMLRSPERKPSQLVRIRFPLPGHLYSYEIS